jgi:hypothetical protein
MRCGKLRGDDTCGNPGSRFAYKAYVGISRAPMPDRRDDRRRQDRRQ